LSGRRWDGGKSPPSKAGEIDNPEEKFCNSSQDKTLTYFPKIIIQSILGEIADIMVDIAWVKAQWPISIERSCGDESDMKM